MIERKTWKEFQDAKLLWWVNRILHAFGWAIVFDVVDGTVADVYPARVKFRGFDESAEADGFAGLTEHLKSNISDLLQEARS